jgi:hypothetical protein
VIPNTLPDPRAAQDVLDALPAEVKIPADLGQRAPLGPFRDHVPLLLPVALGPARPSPVRVAQRVTYR